MSLEDILYSPVSQKRWEHLWKDLDKQNARGVRLLLSNLEKRVVEAHDLRERNPELAPIPPDQKIVDLIAEVTAYVYPRLIAHHIAGVQPLVAEQAMIHVLEYKKYENLMRLEISNKALEACTRNTWTRIGCDAETNDPWLPDIEETKRELIIETDQELLRRLRNLPSDPRDTFKVPFPFNSSDAATINECEMLCCMIRRESHRIACNTRRSCANFAIVSPLVLKLLETTTSGQFERDPEHTLWETSVYPESVEYVGMLKPGIKVFCDPYSYDETSILTGYKGDSAIDAGYIWSPYVLADPSSRMVDPNTFGSFYTCRTKVANYCLNCAEDTGFKGHDYYGLIGIDTIVFDGGGLL